MKSFDRLLVLAALAVGLLALLRPLAGNDVAIADAPKLDRLGPTDGVVLRDGADELILTARDGNLAFGDKDEARAWVVGAMHSDRAMQAILRSETFAEERESVDEDLREQNGAFETEFNEAQAEFGDVQPGDDRFPEAEQAVGEIMQRYQAFQQEAVRIRSAMHASQLERAYRQMLAAVEVVAERRDIDMVVRFIPPQNPFESQTVEQAMLQIQLRSMLTFPEAIEITDDVMEELDLEG